MEKRRETDQTFFGLRFDNHISIGHIITTIMAIVTGTILFVNMQNDISNLKANDVRIERTQVEYKTRIDAQIFEYRSEYKSDMSLVLDKLDKIYDKLDKKADKRP